MRRNFELFSTLPYPTAWIFSSTPLCGQSRRRAARRFAEGVASPPLHAALRSAPQHVLPLRATHLYNIAVNMTEARPSSVPSESAGKRGAKGDAAEGPCGFPTASPWGAGEHSCALSQQRSAVMVSRESPFLPSHARGTTPRTNRIRSTTGRGREDGVRQHLLGARAGHRGHRARAHHEGSLQLAVRRHRGGSAACSPGSTPSARWTPSSAATFIPAGGTEDDALATGLIPALRRQRGHLRVPGDPGHSGGAHQLHGRVGGVRQMGGEECEEPASARR